MSSHIYHDSPKKNRFIGAMQAGQSLTEATNNFDIPKQTASDLWKKFQKTGLTHILDLDIPQKSVLARNKQLSMRQEPIAESLFMKLENSSHPTFPPAQSGPFCMRLGCIGGKPVRLYTFARTKRSLGNVGQRIIGVGQQRTGCR
jgi:hypothetical protein